MLITTCLFGFGFRLLHWMSVFFWGGGYETFDSFLTNTLNTLFCWCSHLLTCLLKVESAPFYASMFLPKTLRVFWAGDFSSVGCPRSMFLGMKGPPQIQFPLISYCGTFLKLHFNFVSCRGFGIGGEKLCLVSPSP